MRINTIIVNGDEANITDLKKMLRKIGEDVDLLATATTVQEAKKQIADFSPDLVILDIEMPGQNGFQLLEYFSSPDFEVIFTTAFDHYAVKAFRMPAIDYLIKPVKESELAEAIDKVREKKYNEQINNRLLSLKESIGSNVQKLALPVKDGFVFIKPENIIRCEAQGNYTMFFLEEEKKILVSKTLKVFDDVLKDTIFFRISRSHLINLKHVYRYNRHKSPTVILSDGSELPIAEARKQDFLKQFDPF